MLAFLAPPFWLLWHRLWIEAALALAAMLGLALLGEAEGYGWSGSVFSLLLSIYIGLEGVALRIAALRRRGWVEWGAVDAESNSEAEIRYAVGAADNPMIGIELPWQSPRRPARPSSGSALGLLSYPGRA